MRRAITRRLRAATALYTYLWKPLHRRRILKAIFERTARSDSAWRDIEALIIALGGEIAEGRGSRRRVVLRGARAVFHRPHPKKEADKGTVRSVQRFLNEAGVSS